MLINVHIDYCSRKIVTTSFFARAEHFSTNLRCFLLRVVSVRCNSDHRALCIVFLKTETVQHHHLIHSGDQNTVTIHIYTCVLV